MKLVLMVVIILLFGCDENSAESTKSNNLKPSVHFTISPSTIYVDSVIEISVHNTTDDKVGYQELMFQIKWDDAHEFESILDINKIKHQYDLAGDYFITVKAIDPEGLEGELRENVTVLKNSTNSITHANVFFIGHSLVNFDMPKMLDNIADSLGKDHTYDLQVINGSPLKYNWTNSSDGQGSDSKITLPKGNFDVLVMTEAVPLQNHLTWSDTYVYAAKFDSLARSSVSNVRSFIYETWHCINDSCAYESRIMPWRQKLDEDLSKWEAIVDSVKQKNNTENIYLLPAGQAMALLNDKILLGDVPGYSSYKELFVDDIHLNDVGNYFIALVQYATIYQSDPFGAVYSIKDEWGTDYDAPTKVLAEALQKIAWEAVTVYTTH